MALLSVLSSDTQKSSQSFHGKLQLLCEYRNEKIEVNFVKSHFRQGVLIIIDTNQFWEKELHMRMRVKIVY